MDINDGEIDKLSKRTTNDTIEATVSNLSSSPRQSERSSLSIQPEWYQPSETRIDISLSSEPTPEAIDACTFSPDGNHLATYSGAEGKITIWNVDKLQQGHQLQPYWVSNKNTILIPRQYLKKTKSFAPLFTYEQNMSDVDFALSNGGRFVALSTIKLPQQPEDPTPFELVNPPSTKPNRFFTYVVRTTRDRPVFRHSLVGLKGAIKFSSDSKQFILADVEYDLFNGEEDGNYLYILSTADWIIKHKVVIDAFASTLQVAPHPWTQIKSVKNSLLEEYFVYVEQWDTASLWSISTGQLITRFRCLPEDTFLGADAQPTIFSLSNNREMLATWTSRGVLTVFLREGGLIFSSSLTSDTKNYTDSIKRNVIWLEGDEHIMTVNAVNTEHKIQIWNVYTCDIVHQYDNLGHMTVFQPGGTGLYVVYDGKIPNVNKINLPMTELEKEHATDTMKKTEKIIGRHHFVEQGFTRVIACNGDRLYESGPGYERDPGLQNDHPIVELRIEPWNIYNPVKSAFILDDKRERVLFIGKQTVQLWTFGSGAKRLQYVWCKPLKDVEGKVPVTVYAIIIEAILKRVQGDRFVLQVTYAISNKDKRSFSKFGIQPTNEFSLRERIQRVRRRPRNLESISDNESKEEELLLPSDDEFATFNIITHASYVLGFLDHIERKYWIQIGSGNSRHHFEELLQKCSNIVYDAIQSHTHLFNQIVKGQSPLELLIRSDCKHTDKMIKALLKTNKHIPRFHDSNRTKSALSRAISLGKTDVVHALLNYYCRRASENPVSWTITVVPAYNKLRLMYPDFSLEVMEKLSYLPSTKNIERSDREENFAFSKVEELTREADDTLWQKFKTFYYKSERRIDHQIEKANDLIRIPHKTHPARECVVPLPGFTVYRSPPKKTAKELSRSRFPLLLKFIDRFRWRKFRSPFVETALSGRYDIFGEPAMEAVIDFKWRKFARMRIFFFILMYLLYVAAYATAITLNDPTDPNYVLAHATKIRVLLYFVLAFGTANLLLELTKIYGQWEHYWYSAYNYINLASTILPLLYTGKLLGDLFIYRPPYVGASLFFVYVNLILQFRVFKSFGISVFIIFQIFRKVFWFIVIIGIMVLAYAHMFLLLFEYPDVVNALVPNSTAPGTFDTYPMSLVTVYFFVTGDFSSANDAFSDPTIAILTIVFSFTTAIILLNILIALMSDVIEVTKTDGKRAWLQQKAEIIAAVEMYMLSPSQRRRKDFFPSLIYYRANPDQVKAYKTRRQEGKTTQDEIYHDDDADGFVGFDANSDYDESINEVNHSTKPSIWSSKKSVPSDAGSIVS